MIEITPKDTGASGRTPTMLPKPFSAVSRRRFSVRGLVAATAGAVGGGIPSQTATAAPAVACKLIGHDTLTVAEGTRIYFKDWGSGPAIVFSHGWPLSADAFEDQKLFLASQGFQCIAHDRRGHGRSGQPWGGNDIDTYADDLATLIQSLDLHGVVCVGHSTGGGEVARYIGRHGTGRVAKAVLISSISPKLLKSAGNPGGIPIAVCDDSRRTVQADRSKFWKDLSLPFYGYNRPEANVSETVRDAFWMQCMMAGMPASS